MTARFAGLSMAKAKRVEKAEEKEGDYEFKVPDFDERAFVRREVASAKASFYVLGVGILAGILAVAATRLGGPDNWALGWLPIFASMAVLRPALQRLGVGEDVTAWKALAGSYFMAFFTGLSVWILGVNMI